MSGKRTDAKLANRHNYVKVIGSFAHYQPDMKILAIQPVPADTFMEFRLKREMNLKKIWSDLNTPRDISRQLPSLVYLYNFNSITHQIDILMY